MKYTYNEISKQYGIKKSILYKRVSKLKIKRIRNGLNGTAYFNQNQVYKIIDFKPVNFKNHSRKIQIIEMNFQGFNGRKIAEALRISTKLSYNCIKEFEETGCIVVQSKMN